MSKGGAIRFDRNEWAGYGLAAAFFLIGLLFLGDRKLPAALLIVPLGIVYSLAFSGLAPELHGAFGIHLPVLHVPTLADVGGGGLGDT